ncbi:TlpA disulfide reductase family protein [Frankia sp. CcI49]|uniref:TlpA family protein disulfide reductase n=1 Tax=Frankia sp. CcI49 TaxID=1745382 RepID=UPI0013044A17|nr:TlpA disulfide reductase family protein [Frankia sp. CcI49]
MGNERRLLPGSARLAVLALVVGASLVLAFAGCSPGASTADGSAGGSAGGRAERGSLGGAAEVIPAADRKPAPAMSGRTLTADAFDLSSIRGRPAVVNFWASWCGPCRAETKALVEMAQTHPEVAFIGVNREADGSAAARAFVRDNAVHYPNIVDERGTVAARWNVPGLPTTFVLDSDGRIAARLFSAVTSASLNAVIAGLI